MTSASRALCPDRGRHRVKRWPAGRQVLAAVGGLAGLVTALALPAAAQEAPADDATMARYAICLDSADGTPSAAVAEARAWRTDASAGAGGEVAAALATHCLAVALVGRGSFAQAATALTALLEDLPPALAGNPVLRLELQVQTGHAWLLSRQPDLAEEMFDLAVAADPQSPAHWSDRARARADQGKWRAALADLDQALRLDPEDAAIYALRASAWRHSGNPGRAMEDVELALALAPRLPEALLERGILRHAKGDLAGARDDWQQIRAGAPQSVAAATAGRLLEETGVSPAK